MARKLSALELMGPLAIVAANPDLCRRRDIVIWVDNAGSVAVWRKGYSTACGLCTTIVKALSTVAAALGAVVHIQKIRRCSSLETEMADALSKADFTRFRREAADGQRRMEVEPMRLPASFIKWADRPTIDHQLGHAICREMARATDMLGYMG